MLLKLSYTASVTLPKSYLFILLFLSSLKQTKPVWQRPQLAVVTSHGIGCIELWHGIALQEKDIHDNGVCSIAWKEKKSTCVTCISVGNSSCGKWLQ